MKRQRLFYDGALLGATLALVLVGMVMVFSASAGMAETRFGTPYLFFKKQLLWDGLGLLLLFIGMRIDYHQWQKWALPLLFITFIALVLVLFIGPVVKGAQRWIYLGSISFQPSELAKISLILWTASFLDRHRSHIREFSRGLLPPLLVLAGISALILKEPDLGTPILLGLVCFALLFLSGARTWHLAGVTALAAIPLYYELFHVGYRAKRLAAFLNPWADAQGSGYQLTQALLAFGSGGLWGKGIGNSQLKQLSLPDPHTDFIFPVLGEELGFIGAAGLVLLFVFWGIRAWRSSKRAPDLFGQLLAAGIALWVLLQAAFNMCVSLGLFPTKGLPMPFVSFGGSAILITLAATGILLNISAQSGSASENKKKRRR